MPTTIGARKASCVLVVLLLFPSIALGQSAIAGLVRDTSGAVLPGVTIEAASPALIEKTRSAVSDSQGQYRIVDLRPGTYVVTFSLVGFATVKREGLELPASFTATINAELKVGELEETVTVMGQSPTVDVQTVAQQQTLSNNILDSVPTQGRLPQSYVVLLPGVVAAASGSGGQQGFGNNSNALAIHGGRSTESNVAIDGMATRNVSGVGGGNFWYYVNQGIVQEVVVSTGGSGAEQQMSGIVTNIIPKEGGNRYSGSLFVSYGNEHFQSNNISPELEALGLSTNGIKEQWDYNPSFGGPIKANKLWFYASYRDWGADQFISGSYYRLGPLNWTYTPDKTKPAHSKITDKSYNTRLTWQASEKNKVSLFVDVQPHIIWNRNALGTVPPEATTYTPVLPTNFIQLGWKSPLNSRVLLEAGFVHQTGKLNPRYQFDPPQDPATIAATESTTGFQIRAAQNYNTMMNKNGKLRLAGSYITGTHAFKAGFDFHSGIQEQVITRNGDYTVTLRQGSPTQLTQFAPVNFRDHLDADTGLFVQDQWTLRRASVNLGIRYDYLNASALEADVPANRWLPARHFDKVDDVPKWHDVSPRFGVSYDLFGTGGTAVKVSAGRYVQGQAIAIANANNPQTTSVLSANRNWTDANLNFIPDCDFSIPGITGECQGLSNTGFGGNNPRATTYDPDVLHGWGKRGFNWETAAGVQHELLRGTSLNFGYYRRWYGNQTVTDNTLVVQSDYTTYCITAPTDPNLPTSGERLCGFADVSQAKFGLTQNNITFAKKYGTSTEVYNGVDLTINSRMRNGIQLSGGLSTGRTELDACFVIDSPQALIDCNVAPPFRTQYKFFGVAPLPWWDIQTSAAFRSVPGPEISANYTATNAEIQPSLGRPLASGANGTAVLPLVPLGTMFEDRTNDVSVRFSKVFRYGRVRILGSLDIQNMFNSAGTQALNVTYGPSWQVPTVLLGPRFYKIGAQLDF